MEWRSIDDIPTQDGSRFMAFGSIGPQEGIPASDCWVGVVEIVRGEIWRDGFEMYHGVRVTVAKWAPLPRPPDEQ